MKSKPITQFLDTHALRTFGISRTEALARHICIKCRRAIDPLQLAPIDFREYNISALCPKCWDDITSTTED